MATTTGTYAKLTDSGPESKVAMVAIIGGLKLLVAEYANLIKAHIRESFETPKHGNVYRGKSGNMIQGSAPGESPAIDEGKLRAAVAVRLYGNGLMADVGILGNFPIYAHNLEVGTTMEARPYIEPAAQAFDDRFYNAVKMRIV
jgi:hypothetical protein